MSIRTGVVIAVTFQQVDRAPDAKTGTKRHNEGLKNTNSRVKESHNKYLRNQKFVLKVLFPPFQAGKKTQPLIRYVVGGVYLKNFVDFIGFWFQPGGQELLYVKGVPWVCIGCQVVIGMLGDVVLI